MDCVNGCGSAILKAKCAEWFEGQLCKYCGINPDAIEDMSVLYFYHAKCWQQYRKNGEVYRMPAHAG